MNKVTTWPQFVDKLTQAKKKSLSKGISVPAITRLIYAGAFDSFLSAPATVDTYKTMYNEVKAALKSKASLPKASKTQTIGIDEIDSGVALHRWKNEVSPIFRFSLIELFKHQLSSLGYLKNPPSAKLRNLLYIRERELGYRDGVQEIEKTAIVDSWEAFWKMPQQFLDSFLLDSVMSRDNRIRYKFDIAFVGFVSAVENKFYGPDAKEMIKVKLYLGKDHTNFLIQWPDRNTGKIPIHTKSRLELKRPVLMRVKPNLYKDKFRGGTVIEIHPFTL